MRDKLIDWCLFMTAWAIAAVVLFGSAKATFGDGGFSYSASASTGFTYTVPKPPPKTARKIVYVYYAPFNCPPCDIQRAELKGFNDDPESPFEIREPKPGEVPFGPQWYPYTLWQNGAGEWVHIPPWRGKKYLIDTWVASQAPKTLCATGKQSLQVRLTTEQLREFARTYSGPMTGMAHKRDSYWAHLLDHGYSRSQITGLSEAEASRIHGATHAGLISPTYMPGAK